LSGYEHEPSRYGPLTDGSSTFGPSADGPLAYGPLAYGYEPGEEPKVRRPMARIAMVVGVLVALVLAGAVAFAGTVVLGLGHTGGTPKAGAASGAGGGQVVGDPAVSEATGAPTEEPTPSATSPSPARSTPGPQPTAKSGGEEHLDAETAVLAIINSERAKNRCQALTVDPRLAAAARKHSADMVARHYFSHTTPDGVDFATRISNEGYPLAMAGENIAADQATPTAVMRLWMKSRPHRANILNCKYRQIGIGVANDGRSPVWTLDFGTQR
jgi:uncharacterized protein YkwD